MTLGSFISTLVGALVALAAISAGATTPLGWLNFFVLQWFGIRLARKMEPVPPPPPGAGRGFRRPMRQVGWTVLRWVWPLTGWWGTRYRYIARRS